MSLVAENTFLWQKLAIEVNHTMTVEDIVKLLRMGVKLLVIPFGLHTKFENEKILDRSNKAITIFALENIPWKPVIGIACELSGNSCRLKFGRRQGSIEVVPGQKIILTSDTRYEDKFVNYIIYVTNFKEQLAKFQVKDIFKIQQIELKICKINGKFMHCCVITQLKDSCPLELRPFDRLIINSPCTWRIDESDKSECLMALYNNCHYIILPDIENHIIIHAIDEIIQLHIQTHTIHTIAKLAPTVENACVKHIIQHVAGVITQDAQVIKQCKQCCKSTLFETTHLDQLHIEDIVHQIDVFITNADLLETLKSSLKEINQTTVENIAPNSIKLQQKQRAMSQCIENASVNCKANAIILCMPNTLCESEKLSRARLLCPILITTRDNDSMYYLLLRKYCFPVSIPQHIKSNRQLMKYAIVYGRRFGYLLTGNLVVSGFGENCMDGLELRHVPDDFILGFQ